MHHVTTSTSLTLCKYNSIDAHMSPMPLAACKHTTCSTLQPTLLLLLLLLLLLSIYQQLPLLTLPLSYHLLYAAHSVYISSTAYLCVCGAQAPEG
jgi:hypothetical protein